MWGPSGFRTGPTEAVAVHCGWHVLSTLLILWLYLSSFAWFTVPYLYPCSGGLGAPPMFNHCDDRIRDVIQSRSFWHFTGITCTHADLVLWMFNSCHCIMVTKKNKETHHRSTLRLPPVITAKCGSLRSQHRLLSVCLLFLFGQCTSECGNIFEKFQP